MLKEDGAYKMIHEERSVFWELKVSVILREEVNTTMYLIVNGYETELFESPDLTPLYFCMWGWMKSEVYKIKVDAQQKLLACIWDVAARIQKLEDQFRRKTSDLRTRAAKCTEIDGGICENVL
jgi:hypothetical protein